MRGRANETTKRVECTSSDFNVIVIHHFDRDDRDIYIPYIETSIKRTFFEAYTSLSVNPLQGPLRRTKYLAPDEYGRHIFRV